MRNSDRHRRKQDFKIRGHSRPPRAIYHSDVIHLKEGDEVLLKLGIGTSPTRSHNPVVSKHPVQC